MTNDWMCEGGHPLYLIDGAKICPLCNIIAERGLKSGGCKVKLHTVPEGSKACPTCERYRKRPWWRELDETGKGTCPGGHEMTHAELKYSMREGRYADRRCPLCLIESQRNAQRAFLKKKEEVAAAEGRVVRHRSDPKKRLPPDYIDWVVALRLIEGKVDDVYEMMRGTHKGPTAMEKWVAYNTNPYAIPTRTYGGPSRNDKSLRFDWEEVGRVHKFKPRTLAQVMAEL